MSIRRFLLVLGLTAGGMVSAPAQALFRPASGYLGDQVPDDIEKMYVRGLDFLARNQSEDGQWKNQGESGPAISAFCILAYLAHGEDSRFGRYAPVIRRGVEALIRQQDTSGYLGPSMYHHGFGTLALAEAYGVVDVPGLGAALEKAVNLILDSQKKNPMNAWRYSPQANDADTTVSGAQLVALFAARNAGIGVPDEAISRALVFYQNCQASDGSVGYTSADGGSGPRNAIAVLVSALARERDTRLHRLAWVCLANNSGGQQSSSYYFYYLYYAAQAFFHADMQAWRRWNRQVADQLILTQNAQGGWDGPNGTVFCTGAALLSMGLNYRYLPIYER